MQNKNSKLNIIIIVVLVLLVGYFAFFKKAETPVDTNPPVTATPEISVSGKANKDDLVSFSILPGSRVQGEVAYHGSLKGAYFFEANLRINVLDMNKNSLKQSNATATSDWMTEDPVEFEGIMDFGGLPKGPAYFEIHNDNPSDLPENDKSILIPIVIQ